MKTMKLNIYSESGHGKLMVTEFEDYSTEDEVIRWVKASIDEAKEDIRFDPESFGRNVVIQLGEGVKFPKALEKKIRKLVDSVKDVELIIY